MVLNSWFLIAFLCCFQIASEEPVSSETPATEESIQQAIETLDNPSFIIRDQASKDLLSFGEQAKPMLRDILAKG